MENCSDTELANDYCVEQVLELGLVEVVPYDSCCDCMGDNVGSRSKQMVLVVVAAVVVDKVVINAIHWYYQNDEILVDDLRYSLNRNHSNWNAIRVIHLNRYTYTDCWALVLDSNAAVVTLIPAA